MSAKILCVLLSLSLIPPKKDCGSERWDVKTLTDSDNVSVDIEHPKATTVHALTNVPTARVGRTTKRYGIEHKVFAVKCTISEWLEEDDKDFHIVINDLQHPEETMIAEIPDPDCPAAKKSRVSGKFVSARKSFEKYKLKGGKVQSGTYIVTGIAFTDLVHGRPQHGVAPNNMELHPIIDFQKIK